MGKSLAESKAEIVYGSEFLRWFAEEAVRIDGRYSVPPNGQGRLLTMQQPVGPCLLITPWNFPLAMGTRKIGPAVAAGCTMEYCLVHYERGGSAHTWHVALFHWTPEATRLEWGGAAPGGLKTIDDVRKAILSGAIKGPAKSW